MVSFTQTHIASALHSIPMAEFSHRFVPTNGIHLHIAELGSGPAVLLLHGFPEIWYSWRHQLRALADAGFHGIAPDFRGYGLTENPDPHKNNFTDAVDDVVGLLDAIGEEKVFVVAKDWGAVIAYYLALIHPQRIKGLVVLGIPYIRPSIMPLLVPGLSDGYYIKRWAEPGRAEVDFDRFDVATVIRRIYILFCNSEMPLASDDKEILDLVDPLTPLPEWLTEEDLKVYVELYQKSGLGYPMQVPYRCMGRIGGAAKLSHVQDYTITVPVLFVAGGKDYAMKIWVLEESMNLMKEDIRKLEIATIEDGTHFVQEQFPEKVNKLILDFVTKPGSTS